MASYKSRTELILELVAAPEVSPKENNNFDNIDHNFGNILPILPLFPKPIDSGHWEDNININDLPIEFIDLPTTVKVQCAHNADDNSITIQKNSGE